MQKVKNPICKNSFQNELHGIEIVNVRTLYSKRFAIFRCTSKDFWDKLPTIFSPFRIYSFLCVRIFKSLYNGQLLLIAVKVKNIAKKEKITPNTPSST